MRLGVLEAPEGGNAHPGRREQTHRTLTPPLQERWATLENFPALSNGVGVLFLLGPGPLRYSIRKLPQIL